MSKIRFIRSLANRIWLNPGMDKLLGSLREAGAEVAKETEASENADRALVRKVTDFGNLQNIILGFLSRIFSSRLQNIILFFFFENIEYQRVNFEIPRNFHQNRREKR